MFGVIVGVLLANQFRFQISGGSTHSDNSIHTASGRDIAGNAVPRTNTAKLKFAAKNERFDYDIDPLDYDRAVIEATEHAMPAVVSIHVKGTLIYVHQRSFLRMLYGNQIARKPISGMGSGVMIDPDGTIITNDIMSSILPTR
jgi:S1-C subfamily serine protease